VRILRDHLRLPGVREHSMLDGYSERIRSSLIGFHFRFSFSFGDASWPFSNYLPEFFQLPPNGSICLSQKLNLLLLLDDCTNGLLSLSLLPCVETVLFRLLGVPVFYFVLSEKEFDVVIVSILRQCWLL